MMYWTDFLKQNLHCKTNGRSNGDKLVTAGDTFKGWTSLDLVSFSNDYKL